MLPLTFSYQLTPIRVHCCRLGRGFHPCRKPFPGTFFWLAAAAGPCHPGRVCWAAPGPGAGRAAAWAPAMAASTAVLPKCVLSGTLCCWLHAGWSCAVFYSRGWFPFRRWMCTCCPLTAGLGTGAQVWASLRAAISDKCQMSAAGILPGEKFSLFCVCLYCPSRTTLGHRG